MLTAITLPNDNAAILKDTKAVTSRTVNQAQAYSTVQPRDGGAEAPKLAARKLSQRRQEERRKHQGPVLLDTRSGHDRRNIVGDEKVVVDADVEHRIVTGINVYS